MISGKNNMMLVSRSAFAFLRRSTSLIDNVGSRSKPEMVAEVLHEVHELVSGSLGKPHL
jgi:hypothetical protein